MKSKRYICLIFCIALFALISISAGASAILYDYVSKENFETALFENLATDSDIVVRKGNNGGYLFFESNTSSAEGSSCCEGDLADRVYARLDQFGYAVISKKTNGDKISYSILPDDPSEFMGGFSVPAYGWSMSYSPGYSYQVGGLPVGLGTQSAFGLGYSYPVGGFSGGLGASPVFGLGYFYPAGGFSVGLGTSTAYGAVNPSWGYTYYPAQYYYGLGMPYLGGLGYGSPPGGYNNQFNQLMADAYAVTMQNYLNSSLYSIAPMATQTLSGKTDLPTRIYDPNPLSRHSAYNNPFLF